MPYQEYSCGEDRRDDRSRRQSPVLRRCNEVSGAGVTLCAAPSGDARYGIAGIRETTEFARNLTVRSDHASIGAGAPSDISQQTKVGERAINPHTGFTGRGYIARGAKRHARSRYLVTSPQARTLASPPVVSPIFAAGIFLIRHKSSACSASATAISHAPSLLRL